MVSANPTRQVFPGVVTPPADTLGLAIAGAFCIRHPAKRGGRELAALVLLVGADTVLYTPGVFNAYRHDMRALFVRAREGEGLVVARWTGYRIADQAAVDSIELARIQSSLDSAAEEEAAQQQKIRAAENASREKDTF